MRRAIRVAVFFATAILFGALGAAVGAADSLQVPSVTQQATQQTQSVTQQVKQQTQPATQTVKQQTQPVTQTVKQQTQPATQTVKQQTQPVTQTVKQQTQPVTQTVKQQTQSATQHVTQQTQPAAQTVKQQTQSVTQATHQASTSAATSLVTATSNTGSTVSPGASAGSRPASSKPRTSRMSTAHPRRISSSSVAGPRGPNLATGGLPYLLDGTPASSATLQGQALSPAAAVVKAGSPAHAPYAGTLGLRPAISRADVPVLIALGLFAIAILVVQRRHALVPLATSAGRVASGTAFRWPPEAPLSSAREFARAHRSDLIFYSAVGVAGLLIGILLRIL